MSGDRISVLEDKTILETPAHPAPPRTLHTKNRKRQENAILQKALQARRKVKAFLYPSIYKRYFLR